MLNKKYKALIIDCDGTLVLSQKDALPSAKVTEAIKRISKTIHVGIATQRSLHNVPLIIKHLDLSGPSIISGGAQIIDSKTLKILSQELIDIKAIYKIIDILKSCKMPFFIQDGEGKDKEGWSGNYVPNEPTVVFMPNLTEEMADKLKEKLLIFEDIAVQKVSPWDGLFGIVVSGALATKQHGIFKVAKILGIKTDEIIGIGDGSNDFPLLMACGLKVAMGNAVDELKSIADYIAPSVFDDGVADVINKFII